jgi:tetratricopeptide (TPR) repeat protein
MTEGHADYFIGRRREQQRLLPALQSGDLNTVLLTGLGGVGKSTLATRLARALQKDGFTPIAVPSTDDNPLTAGRLIDRCYKAFLAEDADGPYLQLRSEEIGLQDKLRLLVQILNRNRFVLVLDNFEQILDRKTHEILNEDLAWFLPYLVENLTGASRCLVTSRYRPVDLGDDLPSIATEQSLTDFPESAFFKYLQDDDIVEQRYRSGELPRALLSRVYKLLGGTPRFLEQVREVLRDMPAGELENALDAVDLPEDVEENRLRELRDEYIEDLFVRELYASIEPNAAREALGRVAVYTIPMTAEGYAAAADADETQLRDWLDEWRRRTFVAPVEIDDGDPERWIIPTILHPWLIDQINEYERLEANQAAGDWLIEIYEVDREEDHLGIDFTEVWLEARTRFLEAENYERARKITRDISNPFVQWALYDDVIRLNEDMLQHERHPRPMRSLGRAHLERADYEKAVKWYKELTTEAEDRDRNELASARHGLASIALNQGHYEEARVEFGEVLQIRQEIGDQDGEASARHQMASIAIKQGNHEEAREDLNELIRIYQEIGDQSGEASARHQLATIALEQGDYKEAREGFEEALRLHPDGEGSTRHQLASVALEQGDYEEAQEGFEEVLRVCQEIGDQKGEGAARNQLARVALEQGEYKEAWKRAKEALQIRREIGDRRGEGSTRHRLAKIALKQDKYEDSRKGFEEALQIRQEIGDRIGEAMTFDELANLAGDMGNMGGALRFHLLALLFFDRIGHSHQEMAQINVTSRASELGLSEEELARIKQEVRDCYDEARGWRMIQEVFPDANIPDDIPSRGDNE